jgi:cytoskeleton protein RodZ
VFEIGNTLREARVRRNLTLQQVEEDTKIRVKYVQAMENEDFDVMPGATYVRGFLRTYATYLSVDPDVILDEYRSRGVRTGEIQEPFGGVSMLGAPRSHRGRNTVVFVAVICLLVVGILWALGRGGSQPQPPTTSPSALGIKSSSPKASASAKPSPAVKPAATASVSVRATGGSSWVEVRVGTASGRVLYSGTLSAGSMKRFKGKKLWVRLGAPQNVSLRKGGRSIALKSNVGPWDVQIIDGRILQGSQI